MAFRNDYPVYVKYLQILRVSMASKISILTYNFDQTEQSQRSFKRRNYKDTQKSYYILK